MNRLKSTLTIVSAFLVVIVLSAFLTGFLTNPVGATSPEQVNSATVSEAESSRECDKNWLGRYTEEPKWVNNQWTCCEYVRQPPIVGRKVSQCEQPPDN